MPFLKKKWMKKTRAKTASLTHYSDGSGQVLDQLLPPVRQKQLSPSISALTDDDNLIYASSPKSLDGTTAATLSLDGSSTRFRSMRPLSVGDNNLLQPELWADDAFQTTMELWNASVQEEGQVRQLQRQLADINHFKNNPADMIRYLRDCRHNVDLAEKRFRKTIAWRLEQDVDNILDTYRPPKLMLEYFGATVLRPDFCDKDGDPLFIQRIGVSDSWSLYQRFGGAAMNQYLNWIRERGTRGAFQIEYERLYGHPPTKLTVIVDLEGLNSRHMKPALLPLFRDIMRVIQDHYAGFSKKILVIRAPRIFQVIWSLVHHFVDEKTKNLLVFGTSYDYLDVLADYVDLHMLPPQIYEHGRGVGAVGLPKLLDGGRLPPEADADQDLASDDDIDPPKDNRRRASSQDASTTDLSDSTVSTVVVSRLCRGSFSNGLFGEDFSTVLMTKQR